MGNRIAVMDKDKNVIAEINTSLACFSLVNKLVEKYNPGKNLFNPMTINEVLDVVYNKCKGYEEVQLLIFINDKSDFDKGDIERLDEAIEKYKFGNDGPLKHLIFMRDLLKKHGELSTEYMDSSISIAVIG